MILVHYHRDVRISFHGGFDEVAQECLARILARTG